eukprot:TRINITY_DN671_c1_g1_i12.p1 TRINITY_DN671_c1_g1~~TRINITY_DN671_c1_g1_i12.p1  ORF type:complete len:583 (+),score=99.87 TRINITY_DN671_c1_g1_i12:381-2129(+)
MERIPINRCFSCCFKRVIRDDDTPDMILRKKVLLVAAFVFMTVTFFGTSLKGTSNIGVEFIARCIGLVADNCMLFFLIVLRKQPTDYGVGIYCASICLTLSMLQLHHGSMQSGSAWPMFVLVLDLLLVCQVSIRYSYAVLCYYYLTMLVFALESIYRFGLYSPEWGDTMQFHRRQKYECDNLPCPMDVNEVGDYYGEMVFVFTVDFLCTRGFAVSAKEEKDRILASIDAANHIAISLSRFDLAAAAEQLGDGKIPPELRAAFEEILSNLLSYKPYLPQSCFPFDDNSYCSGDGSPRRSTVFSHEHDSDNSHTTSSQSTSSLPVRTLHRSFDQMTASLMIANVRNSLTVLDHSIDSFSDLISNVVSMTSEIVTRNKGTVDLFLGDRVYANFGASRQQRGHPASCLNAAKDIIRKAGSVLEPYQKITNGREVSMNIGMGSGKLVCGDLGSESMLRFSTVGDLSLLVCAVEREGCRSGVAILSEEGMRRQVKHTAETRVHLQPILHNNCVHLFYEIIVRCDGKDDEMKEWMYELENVNKWDAFNKLAESLLTNDFDVQIPDGSQFDVLRCVLKDGRPEPIVVAVK